MNDNEAATLSLEEALLALLPSLTVDLVDSVTRAVPEYQRLFESSNGEQVRAQIAIAIRTYIRVTLGETVRDEALEQRLAPALDAAGALGRAEAQSGRGTEALLNAFRISSRSLWSGISEQTTRLGLPGHEVAALAGSLFDFVDRISAATVTDHHRELSRLQHGRDVARDAAARALITRGRVTGAQSIAAAWTTPPRTTLVLVATTAVQRVVPLMPPLTITAVDALPHPDAAEGVSVLVVPHEHPRDRRAVLRALTDVACVIAPDTPTSETPRAFEWAMHLWPPHPGARRPVNVLEQLPRVLLDVDPHLVALMRANALQPLDGVSPQTRAALEATLASWIRNRGRQDRVAAELFVHVQTVRYRLARLRELLGDRMDDSAHTLELLLALSAHRPPGDHVPS